MASFRKRGDTWRAEVCRFGVRDSGTFLTKAEAREWADRRERELYDDKRGGQRRTLRQVLDRYAAEISPQHRGARWEQIRLAKIGREFKGVDRQLRELGAADVGRWRDSRLRQVSPASVAREQQLVRAALATAFREWGWLSAEKLAELKAAKKPPATAPRRRRISDEEIRRLLLALGHVEGSRPESVRQRVAVAFLLAIATAMRCGEICGLSWPEIQLERRFLTLPRTKNGEARDVPLTEEAIDLLRTLDVGNEPALGITPAQVDVIFRQARNRAGLVDLHFHDSRAEALTRLARRVDVLTLSRIAGHRDLRSLSVYYRETAEEIAARLAPVAPRPTAERQMPATADRLSRRRASVSESRGGRPGARRRSAARTRG
jgi:integrase